jgi:hypothetical protein
MRFGWVKGGGGRRRGPFSGFSLFSFLRRPFVRVHVYRRVRIRCTAVHGDRDRDRDRVRITE